LVSQASEFRAEPLPEPGIPAGYAALATRYDLKIPQRRRLGAIARRHHPLSTDAWLMLTPRHAPTPDLAAHLVFALRYEGIDLFILGQLFRATGPTAIAAIVRASPPVPMPADSGSSMNG
jgi:hypothetical protein